MQIPISVSRNYCALEVRIRIAFRDISIDRDTLWVNSTGCEPNASDEAPTSSARKHHFVRPVGNRPSHERRRNLSRRDNAGAARPYQIRGEAFWPSFYQCRSAGVI